MPELAVHEHSDAPSWKREVDAARKCLELTPV
jgi:hypothetical protein